MEPKLLWGLGLIAASLLLLILEIFVPSAGVLSFVSAACALAGVVALWMHDTAWGLAGLLTVLVAGPVIFFYGLSIWRHTPIGRKVIGEVSDEEKLAQRQAEEKERFDQLRLVGKQGTAVTDLRPVGVVVIDSKRYDALAESSLIPAGSSIRVTLVEGNTIKVRAIA